MRPPPPPPALLPAPPFAEIFPNPVSVPAEMEMLPPEPPPLLKPPAVPFAEMLPLTVSVWLLTLSCTAPPPAPPSLEGAPLGHASGRNSIGRRRPRCRSRRQTRRGCRRF